MTLAPATVVFAVISFVVGALLGWVVHRVSARQSVSRMRQVMVGEVSRLQSRLDQCTADLTAETRALGQARNHGEELRKALAASEAQRRQLDHEVARLPALEATIERLTKGVRAGADELKRLRAHHAERALALDDLQASVSDAAEELQATRSRLEESQRSLSEAQARNGRLEENLAVARRVAAVARGQVDALAAAEQRIERLEQQLQAMRAAAADEAARPRTLESSAAQSGPAQDGPAQDADPRSTEEAADAPRPGNPPPAFEQLAEVLGAGIRELARKFDEVLDARAPVDGSPRQPADVSEQINESIRREAGRFTGRQDDAPRDDEPPSRQSLFERLLGDVLDEVRRERRR